MKESIKKMNRISLVDGGLDTYVYKALALIESDLEPIYTSKRVERRTIEGIEEVDQLVLVGFKSNKTSKVSQ